MSAPAPAGFLALPGPGDDTARTLSERLRTVAFKRAVGFDRRGLSPPLARALAPVQAQLYQHASRDRAARQRIAEVFADLDVSSCSLALGTPAPMGELAASTLREALARACSQRGVALSALPPPSPSPRHLCWRHHDLELELASVDLNPVRSVEAHPDKQGNALDLGDRPADAWVATLDEALDLIRAAVPDLHAELATTLRRIVPVGFHAERHLSCSYREAPGLIYLSLHPNVLTMAEAIVHETQHGKLNALSWLDPVLSNDADELAPSPARPDPRPLFGVLLAVHAFVPVAWLHRALADARHPIAARDGFERRRREVLAGNADGLAVLRAHARPTPTGERVIAALEELHRALAD